MSFVPRLGRANYRVARSGYSGFALPFAPSPYVYAIGIGIFPGFVYVFMYDPAGLRDLTVYSGKTNKSSLI